MPVQTIEELKEKWVNGYKPDQSDFADLFDTIGNGSGGGAEALLLGQKKETLSTIIDLSQIKFDGAENNHLELIPAKANQIILIHAYYVAYDITKAAAIEGFAQMTFEHEGGSVSPLATIPVIQKGKSLLFSSSQSVQSNLFTNLQDTPIGKAFILKGFDGFKISGMAGKLLIKADYTYMDFPYAATPLTSKAQQR